jgi:hypothetical protein
MSQHDDVNGHLAEASDEDAAAYRVSLRVLRAASPLNRKACPSPQALIGDDLPREGAARRDAHVAACPACREDLADFAAVETEPAPSGALALAGSVAAAVQAKLVLGLSLADKALQLIESTLTPLPAPALAPARGDAAGAGLAMAIPFVEGTLELEWALTGEGASLACRATGGAPLVHRVVLADPSGAILESRTADEQGVTRLSAVPPGDYLLRAYAPRSADPALQVELSLRAS